MHICCANSAFNYKLLTRTFFGPRIWLRQISGQEKGSPKTSKLVLPLHPAQIIQQVELGSVNKLTSPNLCLLRKLSRFESCVQSNLLRRLMIGLIFAELRSGRGVRPSKLGRLLGRRFAPPNLRQIIFASLRLICLIIHLHSVASLLHSG